MRNPSRQSRSRQKRKSRRLQAVLPLFPICLPPYHPRFATGRNGFPRFQDRLPPSWKTALARVIKNTLDTQNISGSLKTDSRFSGCLIKKNKYARNHLHAAGGSRSPAAPLHLLHRSRPSQQMATVAGDCHACCYQHLVYLFRQP